MKYMWDGREINEAEYQMLMSAGITSAQPITQAQVNDAASREYTRPAGFDPAAWDSLTELGKAMTIERSAKRGYDAKARRDRIAEGFAFALVQHYEINDRLTPNEERAQICRAAVFLADALIQELDK